MTTARPTHHQTPSSQTSRLFDRAGAIAADELTCIECGLDFAGGWIIAMWALV